MKANNIVQVNSFYIKLHVFNNSEFLEKFSDEKSSQLTSVGDKNKQRILREKHELESKKAAKLENDKKALELEIELEKLRLYDEKISQWNSVCHQTITEKGAMLSLYKPPADFVTKRRFCCDWLFSYFSGEPSWYYVNERFPYFNFAFIGEHGIGKSIISYIV
jgi:hypothetical protein